MHEPITVTDLPQELLDQVFEDLCLSPYTLRSCSLVCRSWTLPCQRVLFRAICLSAETRTRTWSDIFRISPHAGEFVRELDVLGVSSSCAISPDFVTHLSAGLPYLPRLRRVTVRPSLGVSNDLLAILCQQFRKLNVPMPSFTLYFNTIHRFHDIFSHFHNLPVTHIVLDELGRLPDPMSCLIGVCETYIPTLRRLEITPGSAETLGLFIDWLASPSTSLPALRDLRINLWSVSELRELCSLDHFGDLPSSIEYFHCHIEACHNTDISEAATFPLPLVQFSHIKLTAGIHKDWNGRHLTCFSSCVRLWADILHYNTRFSSTNALSAITLTFNKDIDVKLKYTLSAWRELDNALSSPAFRGVRRVSFEDLRGERLMLGDSMVSTKLGILMPRLAQRGLFAEGVNA